MTDMHYIQSQEKHIKFVRGKKSWMKEMPFEMVHKILTYLPEEGKCVPKECKTRT